MRHRITVVLLGAALTPACAPAAAGATPRAVPCHSIGHGKYDCSFYPPGNGISGGAPVQDSHGTRVGYLNQGTNYVYCQAAGAEVYSGAYHNDWWAYTTANDHRKGWVNAVYAHGGDNDGKFGGVPACPASVGKPLQRYTRPPSPPRPAPSCPSYSLFGLRGSGQSLSGPYRMGSTAGGAAVDAVGVLRHDHPSARVQAYSIPYPAASVPGASPSSWDTFFSSLHKGESMLMAGIRSTIARCPHDKIGVIGYSQGAGAASEAMRHLPAAVLVHVRAVTLYADTYSLGPSSYAMTFDAFKPDAKVTRKGHGIFGKRRLPPAIAHPLDICFVEDAVCALAKSTTEKLGQLFLRGVHSDYATFGTSYAPLDFLAGLLTARGMEN